MRAHTPQLYALMNATREQHRREGGPQYKTVLQLTEPPEDFVDGIYVDHVIYDAEQRCVLVKATVSLTEQAYWIDAHIEIYTEAGEFVDSRYDTFYDTNFKTVEYTVGNINLEKFASNILVTSLQVTWQPVGEQTLRSQIVRRKVYSNMLPAVKQITVEDPRNINTQPGENIFVVYDRMPGSTEKVDYSYRANGNPPDLMLDVRGRVVLSGGLTFDKVMAKDFRLLLDCANGCAPYLGDLTHRINATEDGFEWSLNNDWKTQVLTTAGKHQEVAFRLSMDFYCKGEAYPFDLYVASDLDDDLAEYPNYQKIPFLTILWGCLAKGSDVRMVDGSIRKIEDIRIGEQVMNPFNGGPAIVVNTWSGHEKILQRIETGQGKTVDASEGHPLWTEKGPKAAMNISEGDRILAEGGTYDTVVQRYPLAYDDEVFNLELTCDACADELEAHAMVCNGLVVGDNVLQNRIPACEKPVFEPIPEVLKREWEAIRRLRNGERGK